MQFARAPALLALALFLGCPSQQARAEGRVAEIGIDQYKFIPAEITIKVGDSVRWTNREKRTSWCCTPCATAGWLNCFPPLRITSGHWMAIRD